MGFIYTVPIASVAIAAQQNIVTVETANNYPLIIHEFRLGQSNEAGDANEDDWSLVFQSLASGYIAGSGGTVPTPVKQNTRNPSPQFGARINDTTIATGTITTVESDAWNIRVPYRQVWTPETRPQVSAGSVGWSVSLTKTPKASTTVSGVLIVEELG